MKVFPYFKLTNWGTANGRRSIVSLCTLILARYMVEKKATLLMFQYIELTHTPSISHFLYRVLDGKKTTRSQFSVPGLREIHRNLKQEKNNNSRKSFFRKSPFCTFSCINPGFGGHWDIL